MEERHEEIRVRAELGALIAREPFWPFVLVMVNGDRYRIDNPDEIVLGEEVVTIIRLRQMQFRYSILRFNQVCAIDVEEVG